MYPLMSVFNTDFLRAVLQTIAHDAKEEHFLHVGSVDSWPSHLTMGTSAAMIFNTQYHNEEGEHWIGVYVDGTAREAHLFDSLPLRPFPQDILHHLGKICVKVYEVNPQRHVLQHPLFPLCGIYCLAFLERYSKQEPLRLCPHDRLFNDIVVLDHVFPFIVKTCLK